MQAGKFQIQAQQSHKQELSTTDGTDTAGFLSAIGEIREIRGHSGPSLARLRYMTPLGKLKVTWSV